MSAAYESLMLAIANAMPRLEIFDRYRYLILRAGGGNIQRSTIWGPITIRPLGALKNLTIGQGTFINTGLRCGIPKNSKVIIGNDCAIGPNVSFETVNHNLVFSKSDGWGSNPKSIIVEDRVWIGSGAIILPGVIVGHDSVVAAGAVVTKNVPPNSLVGGVPAKLIRSMENDENHN